MGERSHDVRPEPVVDGGPAMVEHILHLLHILHTPGRTLGTPGQILHIRYISTFCMFANNGAYKKYINCIAPMHLAWLTPCEILHQKTAQYLLPFGVCQRMPWSCQKAEKGNCGMLQKYCWLVSFKGVLIRLILNLPDFPEIDQLLSLPMSRQHH